MKTVLIIGFAIWAAMLFQTFVLKKGKRKGLAVLALGGLLPLGWFLSALVFQSGSAPVKGENSPPPVLSGIAEKDFRRRPDDLGGPAGQARALLDLIESRPGREIYSISYSTDRDVMVFGCDMLLGELVLIRRERNGRTSRRIWKGRALERLGRAAEGRGMDDHPPGERRVSRGE